MLHTLSETFNRHQEVRLNRKLLEAAAHGKTKEAIALIEKGADVNTRDTRERYVGRTPLHWAATCGQTETVEALIAQSADVSAKDTVGRTPLDLAEMHLVESTHKALRHAASLGEADSLRHAHRVKAMRTATNKWQS